MEKEVLIGWTINGLTHHYHHIHMELWGNPKQNCPKKHILAHRIVEQSNLSEGFNSILFWVNFV